MNIKNEFLILEFVKLFYSKMFTFYKALQSERRI